MPTTYVEQLRAAATELQHAATEYTQSNLSVLQRVIDAAGMFERASSGSNFGFHSCIYYKDFKPPPPGAHFSSEWGLMGEDQGTTGDWVEYGRGQVIRAILDRAGYVDLSLNESVWLELVTDRVGACF